MTSEVRLVSQTVPQPEADVLYHLPTAPRRTRRETVPCHHSLVSPTPAPLMDTDVMLLLLEEQQEDAAYLECLLIADR
jgi:hypothetical protein